MILGASRSAPEPIMPEPEPVTTYAQEDLEALTIAQIKGIAEELGYTITARLKADIIAEFLEQQGGGENDTR